MQLKTLIALRELAVKDLEEKTMSANTIREQLRQAYELFDQAEADGADEETLSKYREDVRLIQGAYSRLIHLQGEAEDVLGSLDNSDWR